MLQQKRRKPGVDVAFFAFSGTSARRLGLAGTLTAALAGCGTAAPTDPCAGRSGCIPLVLRTDRDGQPVDEITLIVRAGDALQRTVVRDRALTMPVTLPVELPGPSTDGLRRVAVYARARLHDDREAGAPTELGAAIEADTATPRLSGELRPGCAAAPCLVPGPRHGAAMAYDASRRRVVLFGGARGSAETPLDDTWEWDGLRWRLAETLLAPAPRTDAGLAFDAQRGRLLLFGGQGQSQAQGQGQTGTGEPALYGDTWEYLGPGPGWRLIALTGAGPPARSAAAMASGPVAPESGAPAGVVLFGGLGAQDAVFGDTWLFRAGGWTRVPEPPGAAPCGRDLAVELDTWPRCRTHAALAPVPAGGAGVLGGPAAVLLGGFLGPGAYGTPLVPLFDAVIWRWDGAAWAQAPLERPPYVVARARHDLATLPGASAGEAAGLFVGFGETDGRALRSDGYRIDPERGTLQPQLGVTPPARRGAALATDEERGELVLTGGAGSGESQGQAPQADADLDDTWTFTRQDGWQLRR